MEHIKVTQNIGIRSISLNRPQKRNAFHAAMIAEITEAFKEAAADKKVRAILLTAEGGTFCAGGDLEWMKSTVDYTAKQNLRDAERLFDMFWAIRSAPVPVVGRVFGHAFGGGAGLVAACDIVAAETGTQFCFSEVKWGLVPAVIGPFVSEKVLPARAREWFLTAKVFGASEALSAGLIGYTGSMAEIDAQLEEVLYRIRATAPEAVRETKKLHQSFAAVSWKAVRGKVTKLIAARRVSQEGQTGLKAFLEKRDPQWSASPYGTPTKI